MDITLYEEVDFDKLKEVISCDNIPFETTDDKEWFDIFKKQLLYYYNKKRNVKGVEVKYTQPNKFGRYCCKTGLQLFQKDVRKYVSGEFVKDLDFVNCHPVLLQQIFKKYDLYCGKFLEDYNKDRDETIKKHNLHDKTTLIKAINNERKPIGALHELHDKIYNKLLPKIFEDKNLKAVAARVKSERIKKGKNYNHLGAFFSLFLQDVENTLLMTLFNLLNQKHIKVHTLCFDGLTVENSDRINEALLRECEEHVLNETGYEIKIVEKSTKTDWKPNIPERMELLDFEYKDVYENDDYLSGSHRDVAELFKRRLGNRIIRNDDDWFLFDNETGIWKTESNCLQTIHKFFDIIVKELIEFSETVPAEEKQRYLDICKKLKDVHYTENIIKTLKWLLYVKETEFNKNKYLFPFDNGVYDLIEGRFRPAMYEEFVNQTCGYNFAETGTEELEAILRDILAKPDIYDYVLRSVASYLADVHNKEEFFIWYNKRGANGKSTILDIILHAFGDFALTSKSELLMESSVINGEGASPMLSEMKGKRFIYFPETKNKKCKLDVNTIKILSGGDRITSRRLYKSPETFYMNGMMVSSCNNLPALNGTDGGIIRRTRAIQFETQFVENPTKPYQKKLIPIANKEQFRLQMINLLFRYYSKWLNDKTIPEDVIKTTDRYLKQSNLIHEFCEKYVIEDGLGHFTKNDLKELFNAREIRRDYELYNMRFNNFCDEVEIVLGCEFEEQKKVEGVRKRGVMMGYRIVNEIEIEEDDD